MRRRGRPKKLSTLNGVVMPPEPDPKRQKAYARLDTPMTPKEVADWLKVSPITIKRRMDEGMPAVNVGSPKKKLYRFIPRDVITFLKGRGGGSGSGTPPTGA
jgi:hypothetical protein